MGQAMLKVNRDLRREVRKALAAYMRAEGCSCCRNETAHAEAAARLAKLLRVPKYTDGSGYDFNKFYTEDARRGR